MVKMIVKAFVDNFIPPVMLKIAKKLKTTTPVDNVNESVFNPFVDSLVAKSYSQYGEDLVVDALLGCKKKGFYVDVGANDPDCLSNTKRFYLRGWHGINIEPEPSLYEKLCQVRNRDINLWIGIANEYGVKDFFQSSANTLSSFNEELVRKMSQIYGAVLSSSVKVPVMPLAEVFSKYVLKRSIDFMSVDVEGADLDVLKSNDWVKYRPYILIVEININGQPIVSFLKDKNYLLVYYNGTNGIFLDMDR